MKTIALGSSARFAYLLVVTFLLLANAANAGERRCMYEEEPLFEEHQLLARTQSLILPFMEKYCLDQTRESCKLFSNMYVQFMFRAMNPEFQYETTDLMYRFNRLMTPLINDLKNSTSGAECEVCKMMVRQVQDYLSNPEVQKEFMDILNSACNYLPHPVDEQCIQFVEDYVPRLLDLAVDAPPEVLCTFMAMC